MIRSSPAGVGASRQTCPRYCVPDTGERPLNGESSFAIFAIFCQETWRDRHDGSAGELISQKDAKDAKNHHPVAGREREPGRHIQATGHSLFAPNHCIGPVEPGSGLRIALCPSRDLSESIERKSDYSTTSGMVTDAQELAGIVAFRAQFRGAGGAVGADIPRRRDLRRIECHASSPSRRKSTPACP